VESAAIDETDGRLTVEESRALGKAARAHTPRSSHAHWSPVSGRLDPVDYVKRDEETLLPELLPVRHQRMRESAFTFFRGTAGLMAADLRDSPISGMQVQLCGDAHLSNFGTFGSPERALLFDVNDFDETLRGPWEWDVKRMAASFILAGRDNGFAAAEMEAAAAASARFYRMGMQSFATASWMDVWYAKLDARELREQLTDPEQLAQFDKRVAKARARTSMRELEKLTEVVDGHRRIISDPPLIWPLRDTPEFAAQHQLEEQIIAQMSAYRETLSPDRQVLIDRYRVADVALKVVGVGSVGTRCVIALLEGRDWNDPLLLQFKEAGPSVLETHGGLPPDPYAHGGRRVVEGQRLMQTASDILLGWTTGPTGRQFYWRQLADMKGGFNVAKALPEGLTLYAQACGYTLARSHARSGDPAAIAAYLGKKDTFDRAAVEFGNRYADQVEADYAAYIAALDSGVISGPGDDTAGAVT
jgi:uncharacterized protein (DUF2252 family)